MELYSRRVIASTGSDKPTTGVKGVPPCINEIGVTGENRGTRFICIAMMDKNFEYIPCQATPKGCPVGAFQARRNGKELVVVKNGR